MKKFFLFILLSIIVGVTFWGVYTALVGPGDRTIAPDNEGPFVTGPEADVNMIAQSLYAQGYIRNIVSLNLFKLIARISHKTFEAGGYQLSKSMSVFSLYQNLAVPSMRYYQLQEGLRSEQVGDQLAKMIGWNAAERQTFLNTGSLANKRKEGAYLPGTYLFPVNASPAEVSHQILDAFDEKIAKPFEENKSNVVDLDVVLTIASLIQREAGGKSDMRLISGIIWNRLFADMPLQLDATLQYVRGTPENWWPQPTSKDKRLASPYNTYLNKGLPPSPISNPGQDAIYAALHPISTKYLFYFHDNNGQIHAARTYKEHVDAIELYFGFASRETSQS